MPNAQSCNEELSSYQTYDDSTDEGLYFGADFPASNNTLIKTPSLQNLFFAQYVLSSQNNSGSLSTTTEEEEFPAYDFTEVAKMYSNLNSDVKKFIESKPYLLSMLTESPEHIRPFFGNVYPSTELIDDPYEFGRKMLVIRIPTSLSPKDASDKLDDFYSSEWGLRMEDVSNDMYVTVRFK